jgi:hypothetical protein
MKAVIETMRNKAMGSYKVSRVFNTPQTTLERYIKDWDKSSNEAIKTKLGRKQVLPCEAENDLAEHCLLMERKFFGLTIADVMHLAYQVAVRNRIKHKFCKRNVKAGRKWLKNFLYRHPEISVRTPEGLSLSWAQFFKSMNPQWTSFNKTLQLQQNWHHYCTAQTYENTGIERQAADMLSVQIIHLPKLGTHVHLNRRGEAFRKMNLTYLLHFLMYHVYITTVSSLIK